MTVAPGTGIGFFEIEHNIKVDEVLELTGPIHRLELDRGISSESFNEIEDNNNYNKIDVRCVIDSITDDEGATLKGLFVAKMSESDINVCELYLTDHYIKDGKDFGKLGIDHETSKSFKVCRCHLFGYMQIHIDQC